MAGWSDTDERVLRWVASRGFSYAARGQLVTLRDDQPLPESPDLNGLDWGQIDAALRRLKDFKFIDGSEHPAGETGTIWSNLRICAQGLQQVDEWPDLDRIATALGIQLLLDELAKAEETDTNKTVLERVGGVARRMGDRIVRGSADSAATEAGKSFGGNL